MEIVLVELADEGGKVGMLEHARKDDLCKFIHVLDGKRIAAGRPRHEVLISVILEHSEEFLDKVACRRHWVDRRIVCAFPVIGTGGLSCSSRSRRRSGGGRSDLESMGWRRG
jgi:hypothetical protein